jgi:RNAse (barnase) inhibitor barstar
MKINTPFVFHNVTQSDEGAFIAEVSGGIKTKENLLSEVSRRLRFPDYFGSNWDALEECILDLSWISEKKIKIKHFDLPISNDVENAKIYLSIMRSAVFSHYEFGKVELIVYFPEVVRGRIDWLLRSAL